MMSLQSTPLGVHASGGVVFALALLLFAPLAAAQRAAEGPFVGLPGVWSGNGTVTSTNGRNERIRCRATYAVGEGGKLLQQILRCASDSYKFEINSTITHEAGEVSGTWTELTRNASGRVTGKVEKGQIRVRVDGPGFSAGLAVETRGTTQSVVIQPQGADVTAVTVSLQKK